MAHETAPSIHVIARPAVDLVGMRAYLDDVGGATWLDRRTEGDTAPNPGELLVEFSGRACYRSWEPGLNVNVTKVRTDQREYLRNILKSAHGSVLEHANYSFALRNVSRVATHEIVRHRAGAAYSQESLRYVRLWTSASGSHPRSSHSVSSVWNSSSASRSSRSRRAKQLKIDDDGIPFHVKKEVTSALRRLAPIGVSTDLILTMNLRTLRHVIEMRTDPGPRRSCG